ncbi:alpha-N-arabinofuranosidase [Asticcacaulis sp. AND118]|uniref:alpha-N-arabinofuranosidase n=1 Tax=Asticcacaulis sp. AND118 TaxID=2840468 RepID=UPI001CFFA1B1|nr:alpha-N-arabinofuranosidase [Asticcacaulis sp. AND118]UDF04917.1 alpha-N-arabinofuranosidase [Asticcacaulis sp. AND118]
MLKTLTTLALTATIGCSASAALAAPVRIDATLKPDQPGLEIPRHIYGQFSEHLGLGVYEGIWVGPDSPIPNTRGIRNDVVAALKAIKMPNVRWPGGCFADEYHWRDGIGERSSRPSRKNNWWGGTPESNAFGTHEFFDFVEQTNSEAYLAVNVGSSNPTEMREWIEYMTSPGDDDLAKERRANGHDKPFKVPFIGIGNESWGCGGEMRPEYYADEYRRFSAFFHKGADNPAVRVASGSNADDVNWTDVVVGSAGKRMDAISLHYYTLPTANWSKKGPATNFPVDQWYSTFYQTSRMDKIIRDHMAAMDKHDPKKRIALYVDEWGTWYDVEPGTNPGHLYQQNTLRDGIVAAYNFNIFHRYTERVKMTNIAQTVNVLQAVILTDKEKMALTPTYYAYKMYVPFQDATLIPLDVAAPSLLGKDKEGKEQAYPAFNVTAAKARDGKTYIGVANTNLTEGYVLNINLGSLKARTVSGDILTADKMDAHNVPGQPEAISLAAFKGGKVKGNVLELTIPAKSVVVVRLD